MQKYHRLDNIMTIVWCLTIYNLKIIFGNKFPYFLFTAIGIFVLVTTIRLFDLSSVTTEGTVYWLLFVPGILVMFYPTTFGIQNDVDNRMIEILFGIPDYRYKVWFIRLFIIFCLVFVILLGLAMLSSFALIPFGIIQMVFHLFAPLVFLGSLAFMVSTFVRSGSGTAVVMVVAGLLCWLPRDFFRGHHKFDVFLNPFSIPQNMNEVLWAEIVFSNRLYLIIGIAAAILGGLLNLQKREKFI